MSFREEHLHALPRLTAATAPAAALALFRYQRNVIEVIAACALIGLIMKTLIL